MFFKIEFAKECFYGYSSEQCSLHAIKNNKSKRVV
uniref:Uncharacterized protein n=1 Tax=Anguilla anguilla TaxID=7936 RepID=A0A0E9VY60_ANGAN